MARSFVPSSSMTICFSSGVSRNSMILGPCRAFCSWGCTNGGATSSIFCRGRSSSCAKAGAARTTVAAAAARIAVLVITTSLLKPSGGQHAEAAIVALRVLAPMSVAATVHGIMFTVRLLHTAIKCTSVSSSKRNDAIKFRPLISAHDRAALFRASCGNRNARLVPNHADTHSADRLAPANISGIANVFVKKYAVGLANRRRLVVVNERQEGVAAATRDFGHGVQKRTREHHGAAPWRLEAFWPVFGKADLSALEIGIQVDRRREATVSRAFGRVVTMGDKVATIFHAVATHKKPLHVSSLELIGFQKFRHHAAIEALLGLLDHFFVLDNMIPAPLVPIVMELDGLPVHITHEAAFLTAVCLMERNELLAELVFEYVRQDEDRRLYLETSEPRSRRQGLEIIQQFLCIASILRKRGDLQNT